MYRFPFLILLFITMPLIIYAEETATTDTDEPEIGNTYDPLQKRLAGEQLGEFNPFVLLPHRPSYFLPISYNTNADNSSGGTAGNDVDATEVKLQFSFKVPIARNLLTERDGLYAAYTQQSWWQLYNESSSRPFRETNHEPEIYYSIITDYNLDLVQSRLFRVGLTHQSNGQIETLSRSWNRIYLEWITQAGDTFVSFKPWYRIPDPEDEFPGDPSGDDNPDIEEYLGNFELRFFKKTPTHSLGLMLRNNLNEENRGALQLDYTYPLTNKAKGYVQFFGGYGESLIDYDVEIYRISAGIMLFDWL